MPTKNSSSQVLTKAFVIVVGLIEVTGVLPTFAGYVAPVNYLEVTADYRPYQLALGVICLAAAFVVRVFRVWPRSRLPLTVGARIIVAVNAFEVLPVAFGHTPRTIMPAQAMRFKAIAFNVESSNTHFAEVREFVVRERPDVAMFCEAEKPWPQELSPLAKVLPHQVFIDAMGIAVVSRHSIVRTQVFHFGPERGFVAVGIMVGNTELTYVAVHTYSRFWRGATGFRQRTLALETGLGTLSKSFSRPLLVMGDFNSSPWTPAYKAMLARSGLRDARQGFGLVETQHDQGASWLWRPIDHCLYSADLLVTRFGVGPNLNSDHLPVIVEALLPQDTKVRN